MTIKYKTILPVVIAILIPELVGWISTLFTVQAIPTWYAHLQKPTFAPPNWVFAPIWTTLYALMGIASYLVIKHGFKKKKVSVALWYYAFQLGLNFLWTFVFFGLHSTVGGIIMIGLLWASIALTMLQFQKISRASAYLMYPYLLWVSIAALLNFSIVLLNR